MTTTITLETHSLPVEIVTIDHAAERDDTVTTEQLGPHNKRVLYITSSRSMAFKELPRPEAAAVPEQVVAEPLAGIKINPADAERLQNAGYIRAE